MRLIGRDGVGLALALSLLSCESITGLANLEATEDPSSRTCTALEEVDDIGIIILVDGQLDKTKAVRIPMGITSDVSKALTGVDIGFNTYPVPAQGNGCGDMLASAGSQWPLQPFGTGAFTKNLAGVFAAPPAQMSDAPEKALRYAKRELSGASYQASGVIVLSERQTAGCDPGWSVSASVAASMLTAPPYARTYVLPIDQATDIGHDLAAAGGTYQFEPTVPSLVLEAVVEAVTELKECTLLLDDGELANLEFDGDPLPYLKSPSECEKSESADGYFTLGSDKIGLCPNTCAELLIKEATDDPQKDVLSCE